MAKIHEVDEYREDSVSIGDITVDVRVHVEGWYTNGDSLGFGEECPDGESKITDIEILCAYKEETCEDVEITDELREKVCEELEKTY